MLSALILSAYGYCDAKRQLDDEANLALAITLKERPGDVVDADTRNVTAVISPTTS
ncbi:hypothetical protein [Hallella sp.]|uniref:hypothetical protein n=1 Tax=Hallella sp. TaxID=2980186 RepID=UPI00307958CD